MAAAPCSPSAPPAAASVAAEDARPPVRCRASPNRTVATASCRYCWYSLRYASTARDKMPVN